MAAFTNMLTGSRLMTAAVMGAVGSATFAYGYNNKQYAKPKQFVKAVNYPASSNFPDLRKHNNVMAKHLTPDVSFLNVASLQEKSFYTPIDHCRTQKVIYLTQVWFSLPLDPSP